jgi:hypothetical protein
MIGGSDELLTTGRLMITRASRRARHVGSGLLEQTPLDAPVRDHLLPGARKLRRLSQRHDLSDSDAWRTAKREIEAAKRGDGPIIVGPWLSELGFEVLYWIPFLTWCQERFELPRERLTVVSRGGVRAWYSGLTDNYVELLDVIPPKEMRQLTEERWAKSGGQKQMELGPFDRFALNRAGLGITRSGREVLHPSVMYWLFRRFWRGQEPIQSVLKRTNHARFVVPEVPEVAARLPADYVAVKFYFRPSFPNTAENRRMARDLVARLSHNVPVVLLNTGIQVDDHAELSFGDEIAAGRAIPVLDGIDPARNLAAQAVAIAGARAFVGTYGGLSYLAPAYGVSSFAVHSAPEHFLRSHLAVARAAASRTDGSLLVVDSRRPSILNLGDFNK